MSKNIATYCYIAGSDFRRELYLVQGCQVMFTAKITANHIPKYKRPISFLSFLMDLLSRFVKKYRSLSLLFANKSYIFRIWPAVIFAVNITWFIWVCVPGKDYGGNHCRQ